MKANLFRFTLRRMMVAVAAVAGILAIYRWLDLIGTIVIVWVPVGLFAERLFAMPTAERERPTLGQMTKNFAIMFTCAIMVAMAGWMGINTGFPRVISPLPLFSVLPAFYLSNIPVEWGEWSEGLFYWLVALVPFGTFLILNFDFGLSVGPQPVPARFPILMAIATLASGYWFADRSEGISHQGKYYTDAVTIINVAIISSWWCYWFAIRRKASKLATIALATIFHSWLFWFAFPWMGMLP